MTPEQIDSYTKMITAIGVMATLLTVLINTVMGAIRSANAQAAVIKNERGMQQQNAEIAAVKQLANGQMEHVLETKAIVADKLAVVTDKLASITQSPADLRAAVVAVVTADDAKKALDDHRAPDRAPAATFPTSMAVPLLCAAILLAASGCGEQHAAQCPSDAVQKDSTAPVEHHCYYDKDGNQFCK